MSQLPDKDKQIEELKLALAAQTQGSDLPVVPTAVSTAAQYFHIGDNEDLESAQAAPPLELPAGRAQAEPIAPPAALAPAAAGGPPPPAKAVVGLVPLADVRPPKPRTAASSLGPSASQVAADPVESSSQLSLNSVRNQEWRAFLESNQEQMAALREVATSLASSDAAAAKSEPARPKKAHPPVKT